MCPKKKKKMTIIRIYMRYPVFDNGNNTALSDQVIRVKILVSDSRSYLLPTPLALVLKLYLVPYASRACTSTRRSCTPLLSPP